MPGLNAFVSTYLVMAGLLVGSFINLAADRVPRGESVVTPRSHCRACGRTLNLIDLLPVLGYAVRAGRCATCRTPIGISAPLVEAASGALILVSIAALGLWPGVLVGMLLLSLWGLGVVGLAQRKAGLVATRGPLRGTTSGSARRVR